MATYRWNKETGKLEKTDRKFYRGSGSSYKPLREQVLEGYRKAEARGQAINGSAAGINRIWSK